MTTLDALINGLSDDNLTTSNALRKFLVVGKRLKSDVIVDWANGELNGLNGVDLEDYPIYRGSLEVPVQALFTGPFGAWQKQLISAEDVPDEQDFRHLLGLPRGVHGLDLELRKCRAWRANSGE
jgi:hypothetical protein